MIRPARPEDRNYIRSSWQRSYASSEWALLCTPPADTVRCTSCSGRSLRQREVNGFTHWSSGKTYQTGHAKLIDALIDRCNVSVSVASEESPVVDGWIVRELVQPVVHYVYVLWSARQSGVARELVGDLAGASVRYTHKSRALTARRLPPAWTFDPYALVTG